MRVTRFFKTPKGLLILIFAFLLQMYRRFELVGPGILAATGTAMLLDVVILRIRRHRWVFPDGALLTALIIAMILSPREPWYVCAVASAVAIASKYLIRVRKANVFNPAALALVVAFYWFGTAQDWWGAASEARFGVPVLVGLGGFITYRVNRLPAAIAFLLVYFACATAAAYIGDPTRVVELFRTPDVNAAVYFAFFMITDPPTSPVSSQEQAIFGAVAGGASYIAFAWIGSAIFLLAGLLLANALAAVRRHRAPYAVAA